MSAALVADHGLTINDYERSSTSHAPKTARCVGSTRRAADPHAPPASPACSTGSSAPAWSPRRPARVTRASPTPCSPTTAARSSSRRRGPTSPRCVPSSRSGSRRTSSGRSPPSSAACPVRAAPTAATARPRRAQPSDARRARTSASIACTSPSSVSTGRSTPLRLLDRKARQLGGDVLGREEHGRVLRPSPPAVQVLEIVADDEQHTAGRDGGGRPAEHRAPLRRGHLEVEHDHELERPRRRLPLAQVGLHPLDLDAALRGESRALSRATSEKSAPVTVHPRSASQTEFRPAPHARSSARLGSRASTSATRNRFGSAPKSRPASPYFAVPVLRSIDLHSEASWARAPLAPDRPPHPARSRRRRLGRRHGRARLHRGAGDPRADR